MSTQHSRQGQRHIVLLLICLVSWFGMAQTAHAAFPAPWPDAAGPTPTTGWTGYTYLGQVIRDPSGSADGSTGGTNPTQSADIVSEGGTLTSAYFAYDPVNQVIFVRLRLGSSPLTSSPDGGSNDDPWGNVTWSLVIDSDGDGFKEYVVRLNGDTGGPSNQIDDLEVYYEDNRSQWLTAAAVNTLATNSATFPDRDARVDVHDFGASRAMDAALSGGGWFLDWQVPLSALNAPGKTITPSTPMAFGFGTSNSNNNPFQKDVALNGDFIASENSPFPFGDPLTLVPGITQSPFVTSVTATGCGPATVSATVMDTLIPSNGSVVTTLSNVKFYYQPDSDGNGVPDSGSSPTLIGQVNSPVNPATDPTLWSIQWASENVVMGTYVIYAVATDQQGNSTNSLTVSPPVVATFNNSCGLPRSQSIVYEDINHNAQLDGAETGTGISGLFVKAILSTGGNAVAAAAVDATTGAYMLGIGAGTYTLILDNNSTLTDTTPFLPAGYIGTEAPNQTRSSVPVTATSGVANQNFGLFHGSKLSGTVFQDTGTGSGVANNGVREAGESVLTAVTVRLTNSTGSTVHDTTTTDANGSYTFYIANTLGGAALKVVETNTANFISTGGNPGTTGGTYDRTADAVTFTSAAGSTYTGANFGDVPLNSFTIDGVQTAAPGTTVLYPHTFTAGSAGTVSFSTTHVASPANNAWNNIIYNDLNGNGVLNANEPVVSGPLSVAAGASISILIKEFVPANAPTGASDQVTVTANFSYTNASPALSSTLTRTDVTTVGSNTGFRLTKSVDKTTARPGDIVTYTITYQNAGEEPLRKLVINDTTPAFTEFVSASNGPLPANLNVVTTTTPAAGATGALLWTFNGTLAVGGSGSVSFQVRLR